MPCFRPVYGWETKCANSNGKHEFTRSLSSSNGNALVLPCGKCVGCRIGRSREWAIRIIHEATLHEESSFLTLTYGPENLPRSGSLRPQHFTRFMKRLRKHLGKQGKKVRFFHCGEYGEKLSRPHYHAILFGYRPADLQLVRRGLFTSPNLERLWGKGFITIGDVNFQSAAYVARYVTKKITGPEADNHYERVDTETGEVYKLIPEYVTMSRRPGIARDWFQQYHPDVYPHDYCVSNGQKIKTPRYYDKLLDELDAEQLRRVKEKRKAHALENEAERTPERLATREKVLLHNLSRLKREIESDS